MSFVSDTIFQSKFIDVLEKLALNQDNGRLKLKLDKLEKEVTFLKSSSSLQKVNVLSLNGSNNYNAF